MRALILTVRTLLVNGPTVAGGKCCCWAPLLQRYALQCCLAAIIKHLE